MKSSFYQRKKKWLMLLVMLLLLYALLGYFLLPKLITQQLKKQLNATYSMQIDVAQVRFNPFTFNTELVDMKLTDLNSHVWYQSDSASIDFDPTQLITGQWRFSALQLNGIVIDVATDSTGKVTSPALPEAIEPAATSELVDFAISNIVIKNGRINVQADHIKQNYAVTLQDIQIESEQFVMTDKDSTFKLSISTEKGEEMIFNGSFNFLNQHIMSQFTLNDVLAQSINDILPDEALLDIQSGLIVAQGFIDWQFESKPNIRLDSITFKDIAAAWQPGITINGFQANLETVSIDTENNQIEIESITSTAADWQVSLPLNDAFDNQSATETTPREQTWTVNVGQIKASNWPITWQIQSQPLNSKMLQFEAIGFNNSAPFNWQADFKLTADEARLRLNSQSNLVPLNIKTDLELSTLNLKTMQPWMQPLSDWQFTQGILNTQQQLSFDGSELMMQGKLNIEQGMIFNDITQATAQWQLLEIAAVSASSLSQAIIFDQISIDSASGMLPDVPASDQIADMESVSTVDLDPDRSKTNSDGWSIQIGDINYTDKKY
ncbi:DUF748 domain-containing protein [Marinicella sp. S1101]|uniref:DUF748 domain-containing protein n=1 Tax=Marinicella marina TaxID=2996016 RepID=UPI0022608AC3|nr:DUF748 domain-containing protein [Marinicella marina]MCX7553792.1 DUF748 domain-containing protein [Marinicella marina]MDJ1140867.1 DUF748 domain-containing protein [Marinicella marina]